MKQFLITTLILLFVFLIIVTVPLQADEIMRIALKDRIVMKTDLLKIKDIVNNDQTDISFIRRYGDIKISDDKDVFDKINSSRLYSILHNHGADLDNLRFKTNTGVHIERGQDIELNKHGHKKVLQLISSSFNIPQTDIEIVRSRILPRTAKESLSSLYFKSLKPIDLSRLDNAKLKAVVENIEGVESTHTLYLKLNIETSVLVVNESLIPGTTLRSEHFTAGRQKIDKLNGKIIRSKDLNNKTFKLVNEVSKNDILLDSMLRKSVLINEGTLVTLSYKTPYLSISTLGKVHGSAEIGQIVRVENIDSKRIVTGKLVSPDLVEVIND